MPPDEVTIYPPASIPSRACRYFIFDSNREYTAAGWQEIDKNNYLGWRIAFDLALSESSGEVAKSMETVRILAVEQPEQ